MNNTFKSLTIITLISSIFILGCISFGSIDGSKNIIEKSFDISDFNAVDISNTFKIEIIQSNDYKVVIRYNDNLQDYLKIEKNGKTLNIGLKSFQRYSNLDISGVIHMPELQEIEASGISEVKIPSFNTKNLEIDLSGSSDLEGSFKVSNKLSIEGSGTSNIKIQSDTKKAEVDMSGAAELNGILNIDKNLEIEASGSSDVNIQGSAQSAELDFSGASEIKGKNMVISEKVDIKCSGTGEISLTVNGEIHVNVSGAGDCNLYGLGTIKDQKITGAGSVSLNK